MDEELTQSKENQTCDMSLQSIIVMHNVIFIQGDSQLSLAFWGVKLSKVVLHIVKSICFKLLACAINL